jgi:hypothetical protein
MHRIAFSSLVSEILLRYDCCRRKQGLLGVLSRMRTFGSAGFIFIRGEPHAVCESDCVASQCCQSKAPHEGMSSKMLGERFHLFF